MESVQPALYSPILCVLLLLLLLLGCHQILCVLRHTANMKHDSRGGRHTAFN